MSEPTSRHRSCPDLYNDGCSNIMSAILGKEFAATLQYRFQKKVWDDYGCEVILGITLNMPERMERRTPSCLLGTDRYSQRRGTRYRPAATGGGRETGGRRRLHREVGLHDWTFQPYGEEIRRAVGGAKDRGSGGRPFAPVLQTRSALQHRGSQSYPVGLRDRVLVPRPGTGRKTRGGGVLRYPGPRRLSAGREIQAVSRWYT